MLTFRWYKAVFRPNQVVCQNAQGHPLSFNEHNRTSCVMSSCVLSSSPSPWVAVNCWKTAPLVTGCHSVTQPAVAKKLSRFHFFFAVSSCVFLGAAAAAQTAAAKRTGLIQMNEKTCVFSRSNDLVWMPPKAAAIIYICFWKTHYGMFFQTFKILCISLIPRVIMIMYLEESLRVCRVV